MTVHDFEDYKKKLKAGATERRLKNYNTVPTGQKYEKGRSRGKDITIDEPLSAPEIFYYLKELLIGKLYSLGSGNIVYKNESKITESREANSFFADLMRDGLIIDWKGSFVTKQEFFNYVCNEVERKSAIYYTPQLPNIEEIVYFYEHDIDTSATGYIDQLLSFWTPFSDNDKILMKAAFLTPAWGGYPGTRPAFIIEGDQTDNGRGIGKTEFIDAIIKVHGNTSVHATFKEGRDFDDIKTRILSGGKSKRILRLDNCKAKLLSSDALEDFITLKEISGRQLYLGEGSVPNYFTTFITLNEGELSSDMSRRAIRIKLSRFKEYSDNWMDRVYDFIKANKHGLISEAINILSSSVISTQTQSRSSFAYWQKNVLDKLATNVDLGLEIKTRQAETNQEKINGDEFLEHLRLVISDSKFGDDMDGYFKVTDPEEKCYLITKTLMAKWYRSWSDCPDKKVSNKNVTKLIKNLNIPDLFLRDIKTDGYEMWFLRAVNKKSKYRTGAWRIISEDIKQLKYRDTPDMFV